MKLPALKLLPSTWRALRCFLPRCGLLRDGPHGLWHPGQFFLGMFEDFPIYSNGKKPRALHGDGSVPRRGSSRGQAQLAAGKDSNVRPPRRRGRKRNDPLYTHRRVLLPQEELPHRAAQQTAGPCCEPPMTNT